MSESTTTEEKNVKKEMNFPDLIKELARLDEYCADSRNDDDDQTWDHHDDVRDAIAKTIYENTRAIAITKWGRPILNLVALNSLIEKISDEDKALVQGFVETRYRRLCESYEWYLASTLVPRPPLNPIDVIEKMQSCGMRVGWEESDDDPEFGHFAIINPTCDQCVWLHPLTTIPTNRLITWNWSMTAATGMRQSRMTNRKHWEDISEKMSVAV